MDDHILLEVLIYISLWGHVCFPWLLFLPNQIRVMMKTTWIHTLSLHFCNTPPRQVRERYCDVHTQGWNTPRMYAKHQYSTCVRVQKYGGNLHSNRKGYKYIVITECDLILYEYYITRGRKSTITRYKKMGDAHQLQKGDLASESKGGRPRKIYCWSTCSTKKTWSSAEGSTSSHTLGSGHVGPGLSESNLTSTENEVACTGKHKCTGKCVMCTNHTSIDQSQQNSVI